MVYSDWIELSKSLIESYGLPNTASWLRIDSDTTPLIILSPIICL
jgi:hypothetical protein